MMARLLAEITNQEEMREEMRTNQARVNANLKEIKEDTKTNQARADANLREMKEEMKSKMDIHQAKKGATIHSIQSESEETIKHRVEDILSCVDQKTQGLHEEFAEKIDETQLLDSGQLALYEHMKLKNLHC
jgi:Skp family chaperone for outer membrane proteins